MQAAAQRLVCMICAKGASVLGMEYANYKNYSNARGQHRLHAAVQQPF